MLSHRRSAMAEMGQEYAFSPHQPKVSYLIGKATFVDAARCANNGLIPQ